MRLIANYAYQPEQLPAATGSGKRKRCLPPKRRQLLQTTKILRLTVVLFLTLCFQAMATGYGQKITLSEKNAPIEKVFKEIRKQTGYQFLYTTRMVENARKVTIQVKDAELEDVLNRCFKEQPFTYEIKDKTIIIKSRTEGSTPVNISHPPIDIKGRLVNDKGEPVAGASVNIKGTSIRVVTNDNGEFSLTGVIENAVLIVSHVQYEDAKILVKGNTVIKAILNTRVSNLDETQVVAYGTVTRRLNSGNVFTIKGRDLSNQPASNPLQAMQGRVPGLMVVQQTGVPGGGYDVLIRGKNSITNGNDPLYIIDGVPYSSDLLPNASWLATTAAFGNGSTTAPSPLNFINLADIESVEVLKDADATAIYGTRAANGVIMITTKKGKQGKTSVDLNVYTGTADIPHMMKLMNTEQYLEMRNEALKNDGATPVPTDYDLNGTWDKDRYTDWQKVLIGGKANYTDAQASVSGGSGNVQYLINGGYHKETTVFPGDFNNSKGSLHFSLNSSSQNNKFKIQLSGSYLSNNVKLPGTDLFNETRLPPNAPEIYDVYGNLNWQNNTWNNPYAILQIKSKQQIRNLVGNAVISYELIKGLELKASLGYTDQHFNELKATPSTAIRPSLLASSPPNTAFGIIDNRSWIVEPQLKYKFQLSDSKFEILLGSSIQQNRYELNRINGAGYTDNSLMESMAAAATLEKSNFLNTQYKYNATFARINYNWKDKYIMNLTGRRDGTSRFGPENRFNNFGAAGLAWLFSNEELIHNSLPFLSFGKIRVSYGTTGNDKVGDYRYLDLYNFYSANVNVPYQGIPVLVPSNLFNPELAWEVTKKAEAGLELGFLQDRFFLSASYFRNRSSNQLITLPVPWTTGFSNIPYNLPALVQNTGWEFMARTYNVKTSDFTWVSSINFTKQDNKLLEFPDLDKAPTLARVYEIGQPISIKKVYNQAGVDPQSGLYVFWKADGKTLTTNPNNNEDRTVFVNIDPRYFGGFQNTITYKSFELDFFFQYVKQMGRNPIYLNNQLPGYFATSSLNWPVEILENRWQKPGDEAAIQKFSKTTADPNNPNTAYLAAQQGSNSWVDASFIRLKNVSLSYRLPASWIKLMRLQNVRLYVQGQNLLTITDYKGMDPESQLSIPPLRVLTGGIAVGL
jgi:TonB-linked SusC/RagA family outer membrane protein